MCYKSIFVSEWNYRSSIRLSKSWALCPPGVSGAAWRYATPPAISPRRHRRQCYTCSCLPAQTCRTEDDPEINFLWNTRRDIIYSHVSFVLYNFLYVKINKTISVSVLWISLDIQNPWPTFPFGKNPSASFRVSCALIRFRNDARGPGQI